MYVGLSLFEIDKPSITLAIGFFFKPDTARAEIESRIKFRTLKPGASVTPNWSRFLKSRDTSRNLDFGPVYPIAEIESSSIGSSTSKYAGEPFTIVLTAPLPDLVWPNCKLPSPTTSPVLADTTCPSSQAYWGLRFGMAAFVFMAASSVELDAAFFMDADRMCDQFRSVFSIKSPKGLSFLPSSCLLNSWLVKPEAVDAPCKSPSSICL